MKKFAKKSISCLKYHKYKKYDEYNFRGRENIFWEMTISQMNRENIDDDEEPTGKTSIKIDLLKYQNH